MADFVREKILDNLKTELEKIKVINGYANTLGSVERWKQHGNSTIQVPCLVVHAGPDKWSMKNISIVDCVLSAFIEVRIRQSESDTEPTDTVLNSLLADIFKCLNSDVTLSGLAIDTQITDVTSFEIVEGMIEAGLIIELEIHYRFSQADPSRAV